MPRKLNCLNEVCGLSLNQTSSLTNENGIRLNNGICFNKKMYKRYLIGEINKGKNLEDGTLLDPNRNPITKTEFNRSGLRYKRVISRYNSGRDIDNNEEPAVLDTMDAGQMHAYIIFEGVSRRNIQDYGRVDTIAAAAAARVENGDGFQDDIMSDAFLALDELAAIGRGNKRKTRSHQNKKTRKTRKIKRKSRK